MTFHLFHSAVKQRIELGIQLVKVGGYAAKQVLEIGHVELADVVARQVLVDDVSHVLAGDLPLVQRPHGKLAGLVALFRHRD